MNGDPLSGLIIAMRLDGLSENRIERIVTRYIKTPFTIDRQWLAAAIKDVEVTHDRKLE